MNLCVIAIIAIMTSIPPAVAGCTYRLTPPLPAEIRGLTIFVRGWVDHDPLTPEVDATSHDRAVMMLREAGARVVNELTEGVDLIIVGDAPYPAVPMLDANETDPVVISTYAAARNRHGRWAEQTNDVLETATTLGIKKVTAEDWMIARSHPNMSDSERAMRKGMALRIPINFNGTRLETALEVCASLSGIRLTVDWTALIQSGLSPATPVTVSSAQVHLTKAITMILQATNFQGEPFSVDWEGWMHIPSKSPAAAHSAPVDE